MIIVTMEDFGMKKKLHVILTLKEEIQLLKELNA
jgi:hypothetical protein